MKMTFSRGNNDLHLNFADRTFSHDTMLDWFEGSFDALLNLKPMVGTDFHAIWLEACALIGA